MMYYLAGLPDSQVVYVMAHLYDDYCTYLYKPVTVKELRASGETLRFAFSLEQAQSVCRMMMDADEKKSKNAYSYGTKDWKGTRRRNSPFLRKVFGETLKQLGYDGWVQSA